MLPPPEEKLRVALPKITILICLKQKVRAMYALEFQERFKMNYWYLHYHLKSTLGDTITTNIFQNKLNIHVNILKISAGKKAHELETGDLEFKTR